MSLEMSRGARGNWKLALVDLDGTLYRGEEVIPGAQKFIEQLRRQGTQPVFFTNNATRSPEQVCLKLADFGIAAQPNEVCTSAQAAAAYLGGRLPAQTKVLYLGTLALAQALEEQGLRPEYVTSNGDLLNRDHFPGTFGAAVLGLDVNVCYSQLARFAHQVGQLGWFVLTNADVRLPSGANFLPGNGALGSFVQTTTGIAPVVTGKPELYFVEYALRRFGVEPKDAVVIGDNLRTDVEAGRIAGLYTIQVLSGVQYPESPSDSRPDETFASVADIL